MKWALVEEQYNLNKGCVCRVKNDKYVVLVGIRIFATEKIKLQLRTIKNNGTVGMNITWDCIASVNKEFNNYNEYKKALDNL